MGDLDDVPLRERNRRAARETVLDAAERLLAANAAADFSMRALAAEAGVGFATPFNHFGSKTAIMQALSERVIERMAARFEAQAPAGDAIDRVLAMGAIAVALLLEQAEVYKAVVGSLGVVSPVPSAVWARSRDLWSLALGKGDGLSVDRETAQRLVPAQLAIMFRGGLSFWVAGELKDDRLSAAVTAGAATVLLGFAKSSRRKDLLELASLHTASP